LQNSGIEPYLIDLSPTAVTIDRNFFECDILWISIPPKASIRAMAPNILLKIERLIGFIKGYHIKQVVFISSTGVYGDSNNEVTELETPKPRQRIGQDPVSCRRAAQTTK
jgi:nucleoside-diphosphate-sugar epimerase